MSEPNSASDPTPEVPKAPSYTYDTPAAATPPAAAPASDPLPPPMYGERRPDYTAAPAYGTPGYGATAPVVTPRRTWDLVTTIILLVVGFFGMLAGIGAASVMGDPAFGEQFGEALDDQGISGTVDFGSFPAIVTVSHLILYVVALGLSILLLVKRKIAFYVPLSAGVVAAIIFWGGYLAVVFSSVDLSQYGQ